MSSAHLGDQKRIHCYKKTKVTKNKQLNKLRYKLDCKAHNLILDLKLEDRQQLRVQSNMNIDEIRSINKKSESSLSSFMTDTFESSSSSEENKVEKKSLQIKQDSPPRMNEEEVEEDKYSKESQNEELDCFQSSCFHFQSQEQGEQLFMSLALNPRSGQKSLFCKGSPKNYRKLVKKKVILRVKSKKGNLNTLNRQNNILKQRRMQFQSEIMEAESIASPFNKKKNSTQNLAIMNGLKMQKISSNSISQHDPNKPRRKSLFPTQFDATAFINEKKGKITHDYEIESFIGKGGYGEVKKAKHKLTGDYRAMKIIKKESCDEGYLKSLSNEINILRQLDHPNIVKLFEIYQDQQNIYMITEYMEGGELFDQVVAKKHLSEYISAKIIKQVLYAINYCHQKKIVHRDLKPENLLLVKKDCLENIKVIDFGLSRTFSTDKKLCQQLGTPFYIAPEVLKKKYDEKCDIWSIGVILYVLLSGSPPFQGRNDDQIFENIKLGYISFSNPEWKMISNEAKIFIKKLLQVNPENRYSAKQALDDPWIKIFNSANNISYPIVQRFISHLRTFTEETQLQQAVLTYMATQFASQDERQRLSEIFSAFDKQNDGVLTRDELIQSLTQIYGSVERAVYEVDILLQKVDTNGSGIIEYSEFMLATININDMLTNEKLRAAFQMFDQDGSGSISALEIIRVIGGDEDKSQIEGWQEIINKVDKDGNGELCFNEFQQMMQQLADQQNWN